MQNGRPVTAQINRWCLSGYRCGDLRSLPTQCDAEHHEPCADQSSRALHGFLTRRTGRRIPAGCSVLSLELLARPIRRHQILRVDELAGDDEQRVAARYIESIEVLGQTAFAPYGTPFLRR